MLPNTLKLKVGLIGKVLNKRLFYGRIIEFGRKASVKTVKRANSKSYQLPIKAIAARHFVYTQESETSFTRRSARCGRRRWPRRHREQAMPDLQTAVQDAFFAALNVASVTSLAPVTQHVPEDTQPPIVIIGQIGLEPVGIKAGGFDHATVEIVTEARGPKRALLFAIQSAVRAALEGKPIAAVGVILSPPAFAGSDTDQLEDGVTYIGTQRFETFVQ